VRVELPLKPTAPIRYPPVVGESSVVVVVPSWRVVVPSWRVVVPSWRVVIPSWHVVGASCVVVVLSWHAVAAFAASSSSHGVNRGKRRSAKSQEELNTTGADNFLFLVKSSSESLCLERGQIESDAHIVGPDARTSFGGRNRHRGDNKFTSSVMLGSSAVHDNLTSERRFQTLDGLR
jgi:hypothetical protein